MIYSQATETFRNEQTAAESQQPQQSYQPSLVMQQILAVFEVKLDKHSFVNEDEFVRSLPDGKLKQIFYQRRTKPVSDQKPCWFLAKRTGIPSPLLVAELNQVCSKLSEPAIACNSCSKQMTGTHFQCLVCKHYILCADCEEGNQHQAATNENHVFAKLSRPYSLQLRKVIKERRGQWRKECDPEKRERKCRKRDGRCKRKSMEAKAPVIPEVHAPQVAAHDAAPSIQSHPHQAPDHSPANHPMYPHRPCHSYPHHSVPMHPHHPMSSHHRHAPAPHVPVHAHSHYSHPMHPPHHHAPATHAPMHAHSESVHPCLSCQFNHNHRHYAPQQTHAAPSATCHRERGAHPHHVSSFCGHERTGEWQRRGHCHNRFPAENEFRGRHCPRFRTQPQSDSTLTDEQYRLQMIEQQVRDLRDTMFQRQ